jgi:hypothetical protein
VASPSRQTLTLSADLEATTLAARAATLY